MGCTKGTAWSATGGVLAGTWEQWSRTDGFPEDLWSWGAEDIIFAHRIQNTLGSKPEEWSSTATRANMEWRNTNKDLKYVSGNEHCEFWDMSVQDAPNAPRTKGDGPTLSAKAKEAEKMVRDAHRSALDGVDGPKVPGLAFDDGYDVVSRVDAALYTHVTISGEQKKLDVATEKAFGLVR